MNGSDSIAIVWWLAAVEVLEYVGNFTFQLHNEYPGFSLLLVSQSPHSLQRTWCPICSPHSNNPRRLFLSGIHMDISFTLA